MEGNIEGDIKKVAAPRNPGRANLGHDTLGHWELEPLGTWASGNLGLQELGPPGTWATGNLSHRGTWATYPTVKGNSPSYEKTVR